MRKSPPQFSWKWDVFAPLLAAVLFMLALFFLSGEPGPRPISASLQGS